MINQQFVSKQNIIDCLKTHYGITVSSLTNIMGGADLYAAVYKAETPDRTVYCVKVKQGQHHEVGIALQCLLHNAGIEPVIAPIKTIDHKLSQPLHGGTLIVYPFIKGQNGFNHALNKDQWIQLGTALQQIHGFAVPFAMQKQIRREEYSPKWQDAVRSIYTHIEQEKGADDIARALLAFMKNHKKTIMRLVEPAETLGNRMQEKNPAVVLCHSDIHAGNVLMQDDGKIFIIDWDEPIMAPKERDLMFIGGGVGNVWNESREVAFFYEGYGVTEVDMAILAYYRCNRILEDIAEYWQELLASNKNNKAELYALFTDMFKPNGVVEIALETAKFFHQ